MDILVAPKPIFNRTKTVKGYYLSFQLGNALLEEGKTYSLENNVNSPFFDFINGIGLDVLTSDNLIFVPVTNVQLATDLERVCDVDRSRVALLLGRRIELSQQNLQRVARFKELGFQAAFIHKTDIDAMEPFFPYIDYIFSSGETADIMTLLGRVKQSRYPVKVIAKNVNTGNEFEQLSAYGLELFEGRFYVKATINRSTYVSPLKVNYIQLLNQVNQDDFELDQFAGTVQRDTALAIQFLKMVNSTSVRTSQITSLRHAAALLGQKEIKKWATTAVTSAMGQEGPSEITRLSMIRAKFCENLGELFGMSAQMDNLFLMGLFSVLDVILETTMERALKVVHVPDPVREALTTGKNEFGEVYQFIQLYELADWIEISRIALVKNMNISDIFKAYNEALTWYGSMIHIQVSENGIAP